MSSRSDFPVSPQMLHASRQDRADEAAGSHVWTEAEIRERLRQLGRERLAKARGVTFGMDEKSGAATNEPQEHQW